MQNAGLDETQAGIKIAPRNINNLRYADNTTLMAESEEELKSLSMQMKEESEKVSLKLKIQKGEWQGLYCHLAYLTYMQSTSWEMLGWRKRKLDCQEKYQ